MIRIGKVGKVQTSVVGNNFSGITINGVPWGDQAKVKKVAKIQMIFLDEKGNPIGDNESYSYDSETLSIELKADTIAEATVTGGKFVIVQANKIGKARSHNGSLVIQQADSIEDVESHNGNVNISGTVTGRVSASNGSVYVGGRLQARP